MTTANDAYKRYGLEGRGAGPTFAVQSSVLDEEALLTRVSADFQIPTPSSCRFLTRGDADIYRVNTPARDLYLKVYIPPHSLDRAESEAQFVAALAAASVPVVRPTPTVDGRFAVAVSAPEGRRPMLLFEEAPPPLPAQLNEGILERIGATVASAHSAADSFGDGYGVPTMDADAFLDERVYHTGRFLESHDHIYLQRILGPLREAVDRLPRDREEFGVCHADLVMSNLRMTTDGIVTLFDFGNAVKTWRAYELAIIYWSLGNRFRDDRAGLWHAFCRGYETARPLPHALPERMRVMLVVRQIGFLGGNCATLPLRLGTEPFESDFISKGMERLRTLVEEAGIIAGE